MPDNWMPNREFLVDWQGRRDIAFKLGLSRLKRDVWYACYWRISSLRIVSNFYWNIWKKKSFIIWEELVKQCILSGDQQVLAPQAVRKLERTPFSNATVQRRIEDKTIGVEVQVIGKLNKSMNFAIQQRILQFEFQQRFCNSSTNFATRINWRD